MLGTDPGKLSDDGSSMNQNIDNMDMESMSVPGTDPCIVAEMMEKHSEINTSVRVPDTDPDTPYASHAGTNQEKLNFKQTTYMDITSAEGNKNLVETGPNQIDGDRLDNAVHSNKEAGVQIVHQTNKILPDDGAVMTLQLKMKILKIELTKVNLDKGALILVPQDFLDNLPRERHHESDSDETIIYDSDETVVYHPLNSDLPKIHKEVLLKEGSKIIKPTKQVIKAHPSRGGFNISVHGVRRMQCRTYLKCKIPHCKSQFPTVRDWNSHHWLIHNSIKLSCNKCDKTFRTPSFLRDHGYVHSDLRYKCEKCDKISAFKSHYRIHQHTHLRSKLHKCFAGSCGWEYKWPQDLHRHIQVHLNRT